VNGDINEDVGTYGRTSNAAKIVHVQNISRIDVEVQRGAVPGARACSESATHRLILCDVNQLDKGLRSDTDRYSCRGDGHRVLDRYTQPIAICLGSSDQSALGKLARIRSTDAGTPKVVIRRQCSQREGYERKPAMPPPSSSDESKCAWRGSFGPADAFFGNSPQEVPRPRRDLS